MNFLPSKRFSLSLGALVIVALGIYSITLFGNTGSAKEITSSVPAKITVAENPLLAEAAEQDSDHDGLKDWEERLWKTDPNKTDTDGDGTNDGDEVKANRDPLVKGPKDSIANTISFADAISDESLQGLSTTEKIARQFFIEYLSHKQNGRALTASEEQALLLNTVKLSAAEVETPETYAEKDFSVLPTSTPESLRLYGNTLGDTIRRHSFTADNELVLLSSALSNKSVEDLQKINALANAYTLILHDLLAMSVPKDALPAHIFLTNQISVIAETIEAFGAFDTDPVSTLVAITNYQTRGKNLETSIIDLQDFFTKTGVLFTETEPGYLLMQTGKNI